MKTPIHILSCRGIAATIALLLLSCSKNPSKFVGVWQTAESGFLTHVTSVVEFSKNGTCSFSQSSNWGDNVSFKTIWSIDGKRLVFNIDENPNNYMEILSHSDTELVLKEPESGKIINYRRMNQ